ncbi:MAG TPA: cupin domain-containing protein [Gaiellaceae bacterium]|jgi:uncharacterized cupin superfamily protein|nr:cupin domain-containing protein [Gaiellaceae bacterium]
MTDKRNAFADDWDDVYPPIEGWRSNVHRLIVPWNTLGMSVYELLPGQTQCPYHFHHGNEEAILVLRGRPTLRTPNGEEELAAGDVVHFPRGAAGAHQVVNRTDEPARYVVADSKVSPEVVEYPDSGKFAAMARTESQRGQPIWTVHSLDEEVDFFDGEQPRG